MPARLIATDLDGTLLRDDLTVSARTRAALDAVREAGILVVPVTARQPYGLREIAELAGFAGPALCSNGALGIDLTDGRVLFERCLDPAAQQAFAATLDTLATGVMYAGVRDGRTFVAEAAYVASATFADHKLHPTAMTTAARDVVLSRPNLKLIARHRDVSPDELHRRLRAVTVPGVEVTRSGAPFLEVQAEGVTKASGLARLCASLDIDARDVIAFGDAPNDVSMLAWASRGIAVANAGPEALAAADEVTAGNQDDGVAKTLEQLVAGMR